MCIYKRLIQVVSFSMWTGLMMMLFKWPILFASLLVYYFSAEDVTKMVKTGSSLQYKGSAVCSRLSVLFFTSQPFPQALVWLLPTFSGLGPLWAQGGLCSWTRLSLAVLFTFLVVVAKDLTDASSERNSLFWLTVKDYRGKSWQWKTAAASQIIASQEPEGNSLIDMRRILSPEWF